MPARTPHADASLGLALAMLVASTVPLVLLDSNLDVVGLSASFCNGFGIDPAGAVGRPFSALGDGEWNAPQLRSLLELTIVCFKQKTAYEMDLRREGRD